jgi:hypothetical protein
MTAPAPLQPAIGSGGHRGLKIFVIGTGRSGTHWLGHILQSHPDIHVTIEQPPIFTWSTEMALDARTKPSLLPQLIAAYAAEHEAAAPRHYADKSHPNIWHAEELAAAFPEAVFLGIRRNPYATIASMLRHPWVLAWQDRWQEFPVPNRFLGITPENHAAYAALPQAARCALRWQAHMERLERLQAALGGRLLVVDYEDLVRNPELPITRLNAFLRLATPIATPTVKAQSLDRWRDELAPAILRQIAAVTGIAIPPA